ncbi:hypothetical protein [Kiloniella majae]|uniref:hypothetical protein n=1 Tax=Kiloniella majae TaxID=1938558 RepID=UPI000A277D1B|nr:hypothetical protein [Kiloniella majae]
MSLENKIRDLATRVGTECNNLRNEHGALAALNTTDKSSLVAAVNELNLAITNFSSINDAATGSGTTWSSSKVSLEINTALSNLVNGAPAALDTLNELATAIQDNDTDINSLLTDLGKRVRTDINNQVLSDQEKLNARTNIAAASESDLTDGLNACVRTDTAAQTLSVEQQTNARTNIGAVSATSIGDTERNLVADFEAALA